MNGDSGTNLDTFMGLLIKLIEKSECTNKVQIDDLRAIVTSNDISINKRVSSLSKEVSKLTVSTAVSKFRFSRKAKMTTAIITFLLTMSMLMMRFKETLINAISAKIGG